MFPDPHPFVELNPHQAPSTLRAIFNPSDPASLRYFAVLDGHAAGRLFTDRPDQPAWAVLEEGAFGSLYLAGEFTPSLLDKLINVLRQTADVLIGLWPDDPLLSLLPLNPDYSGYIVEFTHRDTSIPIPDLPKGCSLRRLDQTLIKEILGRNLLIRMYGSTQQALQWGHGLCLMRDSEILCESFAGPAATGVIEIGVETHPHHLRKGYATITCGHLIAEMENLGHRTYWNCDKANLPSIALARRLGYHGEKEYRLLAWFKQP